MFYTDTNNRKTNHSYIFDNIFIKTIFINCRNEEDQTYEKKTNKISIFKN